MADLQPVHRYAAGALLGLALHQAQVHQFVLPHRNDEFFTEPEHYSIDTDHEERIAPLWTSQDVGLLRPIFRFLQIDAIAWVGLEQTALSADANDHIGAFLKILADREDCEKSAKTAEVNLTEAVDKLALKLEDVSSSDARKLEGYNLHSERSNPGKVQQDTSNINTPGSVRQSYSTDLDSDKGPEKLSMAAMEILVAYAAMAAQEDAEENKDENTAAGKKWAKWKRGGLIGAAAVTGGALLALTGGLAAPAIAAGLSALAPTLGTIVPVIGTAGFTAAATAAGTTVGSVAVAASFGAAGAGLTGAKMAKRTGGIEEFGFEGLGENHQQGRLAVGIAISGFLNNPEDFTRPWRGSDADLEMYALRWETKTLMAVSTAIQDWLKSNIANELMKRGAMLTVLSTIISALAWPSALLSLTNFIDSKWSIAVDRSDKAGKLLADVLLRGLQGNRPVTLMGFSLGARVIFKCLEALAERGENARIVERVVLFGAPISIETQKWETVQKIVAGRFINAYSTNDWTLGVVYRASLMSQGLAGIQAVDIPGIENVDVMDAINGHSSYLSSLPKIVHQLDLDNYFPCSGKLVVSTESETAHPKT